MAIPMQLRTPCSCFCYCNCAYCEFIKNSLLILFRISSFCWIVSRRFLIRKLLDLDGFRMIKVCFGAADWIGIVKIAMNWLSFIGFVFRLFWDAIFATCFHESDKFLLFFFQRDLFHSASVVKNFTFNWF